MTLRDDDFLGVADRIGAQLARDALWHGTHCNWTGDAMEFLEGRWQVAHRALGAELYSGASGVALFLARLGIATGERLYAHVATAAIENALARACSLQPGSRSGYYSGALGVAWAGIHMAATIDAPRVAEASRRLLLELHDESLDREGLDVTAGSAGAIGTLLDLADRCSHDPALAQALHADALRHGERLLATAHRDARGMSWPGPGQSQGLCGLSHGGAGFAWALLALHRASGHAAFRVAADEALRYERSWFDPHEQNWPDLRSLDDDPAAAAALPSRGATRRISFMSAWCHGAPGIALARLASRGLGGDDACLAEAAAGARSTAVATRLMLASGQANFSLCHGLAGNAEVVLEAARSGVEPGLPGLVHEVAANGLARYARTGTPWPCGVLGGGETPSLMLGLAGIGHFYLRLHDATLPTVLIVPLRSQGPALTRAA